MEATPSMKPKTMAELLPQLSGILSKDSKQTLTARKQPRKTMAVSRTEVKVAKPMTFEQMTAAFLELKGPGHKKFPQSAPSNKKKIWNSSIKVDKTVSHTANGQLKHNPVRKVLNFQPKPSKPVPNLRATMAPPARDSPKFPKPEYRAKKSAILQARNNIRISGVCNISETPVTKPIKSRIILENKENISNQSLPRRTLISKPPLIINKKPPVAPAVVPDTPLSNDSWKSSCDASFLLKEKEINEIEDKIKAISEEPTLENLAAVTPPVSTPFKEYRSVQDFFNNSSDIENSALYNDNTITVFDKPAAAKNTKREESVIVSLCDLLKKTSVTNADKMSTELKDLLEMERQTEHNIKMIENSINSLNDIKESQLKTLHYVRKLIKEKQESAVVDQTLMETKEIPEVVKTGEVSPERKPETTSKPCSVIKSCSKSPTYKIPKKNLALRKKVFYKSMPNVSNDMLTPVKLDMGNRALSMYMKMKEHMNFLNTPVAKPHMVIPDTPAVTSHNLQKQLDRLYDE